MNVFELASQFHRLQQLVEQGSVDADVTDEVRDEQLRCALAEIDAPLETKLENIGFLVRNLNATLLGKKQALENLKGGIERTENEISRLNALLIELMTFTGKKKVQGNFFDITVKANGPALKIDDEEKIGTEYRVFVPPQTIPGGWVIDKEKLKEDLVKHGVVVEGARITRGMRVEIK